MAICVGKLPYIPYTLFLAFPEVSHIYTLFLEFPEVSKEWQAFNDQCPQLNCIRSRFIGPNTKILSRRLYFHPNDLFVHDFQCQGTTATCGRWGIAHIDQCLADFGGSQRKIQELLLVTESTCQYHNLICFWNKSHLKDVDKADTSGALARVNLRRYHYLIFASRWNNIYSM